METSLIDNLRLFAKADKSINANIFKYIPLFEEVFDKELWPVLVKLSGSSGIAHIEHKIIPHGGNIIKKGSFDMMVYWLLKGEIEIINEINNKSVVVGRYDKSGYCFGELAIIDATERTADVIASEDKGATILEIDWSITNICSELQAKFNELILKTLAKKLKESYRINNMAFSVLKNKTVALSRQNKAIDKLKSLIETNVVSLV